MKLNIAICDDDEKVISSLSSALDNYHIANDIDFKVDTFKSGKALLSVYKKPGDYHIVLLDIEMPVINGLRVAEIIRDMRDRNVIIVFISNYPRYMQDSFSVHPYHFLQKPVSNERIYELVSEIIKDIKDSHTLYTIIDTTDKEETVNIKDIKYIETINSKNEELCFHMYDRQILTKGKITLWEEQLSDYNFFLCHRAYLVNLFHIHYFDKNTVVLDNGDKIPISRNKEKQIRNLYLNRVIIFKNI